MDTKEAPTITPAEESDILTPEQAAPLAGYRNKVSFMRACRNYGIPFIKVNRTRVLFRRSDLEGWLKSRTVGGQR
jgi:hypothetical protein